MTPYDMSLYTSFDSIKQFAQLDKREINKNASTHKKIIT